LWCIKWTFDKIWNESNEYGAQNHVKNNVTYVFLLFKELLKDLNSFENDISMGMFLCTPLPYNTMQHLLGL